MKECDRSGHPIATECAGLGDSALVIINMTLLDMCPTEGLKLNADTKSQKAIWYAFTAQLFSQKTPSSLLYPFLA